MLDILMSIEVDKLRAEVTKLTQIVTTLTEVCNKMNDTAKIQNEIIISHGERIRQLEEASRYRGIE